MSVLISGMNKPDMCGHCKFATAFDCMASGAFIKDHHKINDDCPLAEVVRCKDCRWGREACGNIECLADMNVPPEYHGYDWFCPNGERK